jgi:murein DD-endopeptidase MepM/ murein hydrolase activator NlpD
MIRRRRLARLLPLLLAVTLVAAGCLGGGDDDGIEVTVNGEPLSTATPDATSTPTPTATLEPVDPPPLTSDLDAEGLSGFTMPIAGGCLPSRDAVLPNAPRAYRNGVHEGVDFYNGDVCTTITRGLEVMAMYDGVVIRADHDYVDITPSQVTELAEKTAAQGFSDEETLDIYRGRQVWIDHGNGVVTRYAHLEGIVDGVGVGVRVEAGDVIAYIGESGTPESVTAPGTEVHLHAEVRIDDSFLGADRPPNEVRQLYNQLFSPAPIEEQSGG